MERNSTEIIADRLFGTPMKKKASGGIPVVSPMESLEYISNGVFLAGPCPRDLNVIDWRGEFVSILNSKANGLKYPITVINPTNRSFEDADYLKQISWEHEGLSLASIIVFWVPRTEKNPAFTTNVEFGEWFKSPKCICGGPKDGWKNKYLQTRFEQIGGIWHNDLESIADEVIRRLQRNPKSWFTSDNHFTDTKKIKTARRPYMDAYEMDWNMISNWNSKVLAQDDVYDSGDFGNPYAIKYLNCKNFYLVKGNHDILVGLEKLQLFCNEGKKNLFIYDTLDLTIGNQKYTMIHEPLFGDRVASDVEEPFYLYGHIHRASGIKRNGINIGVDINNYAPLSVKDIKYIRDGVLEFSDENDFSEICRELREHGDVKHE